MKMYIWIAILLMLLLGGFFDQKNNDLLFQGGYCNNRDLYDSKYAKDSEGNKIAAPDNWYYRLYKLKYKEAFPLSATLLVSFTDQWHRYKALSMLFLRIAFVLPFVMWFSDAFHWGWKSNTLFGVLT